MAKKHKISVESALKELTTSEQFRRQLETGRYIYAENRLCLNRPQYIQWSGTVASLTDYAREHQDECCLLMEDPPAKERDPCVVVTPHSRFRVARRHIPGRCFKVHAYRKRELYRSAHFQKLCKSFGAVSDLTESLPSDFTQMLDKMIASKGVTEEDLAESSCLSEKTIQRLRHHDPKRVTLETILQLCIGLHLHPVLSERLLRAAGQHFMDTKLHTMYRFLIYTCYDYSVEDCNDLLESQGFPSLGKSKK